MNWTDKITVTNEDNMELMARYPDNYFSLAIVDPPYGEGELHPRINLSETAKDWNSKKPSKEYFNELIRVSKNQIVWGSNHFERIGSGCIVWNKLGKDIGRRKQVETFSDCELAYQSLNNRTKMFSFTYIGNVIGNDYKVHWNLKRIHPTQKPVALYEWLLMNYAKDIDCKDCDNGRMVDDDSDGSTIPCEYCNGTMKRKPKILDTHLGSGSIAIACHNLGYELTACELDKDYYEASLKRFKQVTSQQSLF